MPLWLVDEQFRLTVEIPLTEHTERALKLQLSRLASSPRGDFETRLANGVSAALETALDLDLRSPTDRQVAFATAISKALGIPLPHEALNSRRSMGLFLDTHSRSFKSNGKLAK